MSRPPRPRHEAESSPPTRAAAVCSTLKPFQSGWTMLEGLGNVAGRAPAPPRHRPARARPARAPASAAWPPAASRRTGCRPSAISCERLRPGAQMIVRVGEIEPAARSTPTAKPPAQPALADARVDHRRFPARVGADQQTGIGLLDAGDGGVEEIAGARCADRAPRHPAGNRGWASRAPSSAP